MNSVKLMKKVNALQLRQSMGKVLAGLQRTGEPILLEKGRKPVGVIVSIKDFQERFVEKAATDERNRVIQEMEDIARTSALAVPAVEILQELRGSA